MTTIDTMSTVFKDTIMAYRSARQAGEMDHPAFIAAMQAHEGHHPGNSEAGRVVGQMICIATERPAVWIWKGYRQGYLKENGNDTKQRTA